MNCYHCGKEAYEVGVIIDGMPLCAECNDKRLAKIEMAQTEIDCAQCGQFIKGKVYERTSEGGVSWPLCLECAIEWDHVRAAKHDAVEHPAHYCKGKVECIDAIEAATTDLTGFEGMLTGNTIKYLFRWKAKNGIEDLKKAKWYLEKLIGVVEGNV